MVKEKVKLLSPLGREGPCMTGNVFVWGGAILFVKEVFLFGMKRDLFLPEMKECDGYMQMVPFEKCQTSMKGV
jgi:hypothetical protein